jgi:hypothetical protein
MGTRTVEHHDHGDDMVQEDDMAREQNYIAFAFKTSESCDSITTSTS